jgi:HEAT repeats
MTNCRVRTAIAALCVLGLSLVTLSAWATSLPGDGATPDATASPKNETVKKYLDGCRKKGGQTAECDKLRKDAVEILKEDLRTIGSSANPGYLPVIQTIFKSDEPELRIAAADAIGMIGPQNADFEALASAANDPVPDVRRAVVQMLSQGPREPLASLAKRVSLFQREGPVPDPPVDPGKFGLPVFPGGTYLYHSSDAEIGRLAYVASKGSNDLTAFFKSKSKRGPLKLDTFKQEYRYQLDDEQKARDAAFDEAAKKTDTVKPDPANMAAYADNLAKVQAAMARRTLLMFTDIYSPDMFGSPTVYVLEERQIGGRSYPAKYAVLYEDIALKRPGYRLSWMTVPDEAIKVFQASSLADEKREEDRKKENEVERKRAEALQSLEKKKDEQERNKFKKGQADLEKELGF